jgi:hypothetical protein
MNGDVDDALAREDLRRLGLDETAQQLVLQLWKWEQELVRQRLTATQVKRAWLKAVTNPLTGAPWTFEDALGELISRGWSNQDARTFLAE